MRPRIRLPRLSASSSAFKYIATQSRSAPTGTRPFMSKPEPSFSKDVVDAGSLSKRLDPLLASNGGRWALTNGGEALERTFKFKTFAKTWVSFVHIHLSCYIGRPSQCRSRPVSRFLYNHSSISAASSSVLPEGRTRDPASADPSTRMPRGPDLCTV